MATGILQKHRPPEPGRALHPGKPLAFGLEYVHDVRNVSVASAIGIHAYIPEITGRLRDCSVLWAPRATDVNSATGRIHRISWMTRWGTPLE